MDNTRGARTMSIYNTMIKNNIKGFFQWLRIDKGITRINTSSYGLNELIDEYLEDTYGGD